MSQDILINKLFYSKDPFEDLNDVHPYYDGWYDNAIVIDTKAVKKYSERIPYHLGDLVVGLEGNFTLFEDYVNLQRDGVVNMNEMDKVLRLTRLTHESYEDIINHYDDYGKAYPIKEFKYPPEDE